MAYASEFIYLMCDYQHYKQILFRLEFVYVRFGPCQN